MLDMRGDACTVLGFHTDTVHAQDQSAGWAFGRHIYHQHRDVDGIIYSSRFDGKDVYAIFDRAVWKLRVIGKGPLPGHPSLDPTLSRYCFEVVSGRADA